MPQPPYAIEFYQDESGDQPVRRWLKEDLTPRQRRAIGYAMSEVLQHLGVGVCGTEFGKQLGGGLFEFRLRRDLRAIAPAQPSAQQAQQRTHAGASEKILLRVFCYAHGEKLILLLAGYDKAKDPSPKRQEMEIRLARKRLEEWRRRRTRRQREGT